MSELFKQFHIKLTQKVSKITDESRKMLLRDFGKSYLTLMNEFKGTYNNELKNNNEKILIPYLENAMKTVFEKYSKSLETTYLNYVKKIETSVQMQQNLKNNFDSVFENQLKNSQKLQKALDGFIASHDKFAQKQYKDNRYLENLEVILNKVLENQNKVFTNLEMIGNRLENLEKGNMQNLKIPGQQGMQNLQIQNMRNLQQHQNLQNPQFYNNPQNLQQLQQFQQLQQLQQNQNQANPQNNPNLYFLKNQNFGPNNNLPQKTSSSISLQENTDNNHNKRIVDLNQSSPNLPFAEQQQNNQTNIGYGQRNNSMGNTQIPYIYYQNNLK